MIRQSVNVQTIDVVRGQTYGSFAEQSFEGKNKEDNRSCDIFLTESF